MGWRVMQTSNITWTDVSWNPVHGCSRVSEGCDNCYAAYRSYERYGHTDLPWTPENAAENVTEKPHKLEEPYSLTRASEDDWADADLAPGQYPLRIFVNSMSDLFHTEVSDEYISEVFGVMRNTPHHIYQILTKRPGRASNMDLQWPPNVWMGTSVENEKVVGRLDSLRECGADTLFVSFEPLIGSIENPDLTGYSWVIVGGETGSDRRPMAHEWVWPIKDICRKEGIAFFFKQSSAFRPDTDTALRCRDGLRREFMQFPNMGSPTVKAQKHRCEHSDNE